MIVPKESAGPKEGGRSHQVLSDVEPFVSPIDRTVISSRSQIREHERVHGVRQVGNDFCPGKEGH